MAFSVETLRPPFRPPSLLPDPDSLPLLPPFELLPLPEATEPEVDASDPFFASTTSLTALPSGAEDSCLSASVLVLFRGGIGSGASSGGDSFRLGIEVLMKRHCWDCGDENSEECCGVRRTED